MKTFATNLKRERLSQGLTQQQMAEKLRIPFKTYQGYESQGKASRNPDLVMVVRIAEILNVTTDELLK